jgi:hypothetical protein
MLSLAAESFLSSSDEAPLANEGSTRLEFGNNNISRCVRDVRQLCMEKAAHRLHTPIRIGIVFIQLAEVWEWVGYR